MRNIPYTLSCHKTFGPHRPSIEQELTKYVILAGNTDYNGRGLDAWELEADFGLLRQDF